MLIFYYIMNEDKFAIFSLFIEMPIFIYESFNRNHDYSSYLYLFKHITNVCYRKSQTEIRINVNASLTEAIFLILYISFDFYFIVKTQGKMKENKKSYDIVTVMITKFM